MASSCQNIQIDITHICIAEEYYLQTNEQSFILKNITQVELIDKKLMSHLLAVLTRDDSAAAKG